MPEYDLGTAHGRIKIDVDDRGARQADRTIDKLEQTMRSLDRNMASMQRSMLRVEGELKNLSKEFERANKEAEELEKNVEDLGYSFEQSGRSSKLFSTDVQTLTARLMTLTRVMKTVIPPMRMFQSFLNSMGNSNGGGFAFIDALVKSGAAVGAVTMLTSRLLGMHKVMQNAPQWRVNMMRFGGAVQTVIGGMAFINWLSRGRVNAALFSGVIGTLVKKFDVLSQSTTAFGKAFAYFTGTQGRAFSVFAKGLDGFSDIMLKVFDRSTNLGRAFQTLGKGALNTAMGVGLMKMGFNGLAERFKNLGWAGRVVVASLAAIATVGPAAMEALGKGLTLISNLLVGAWDGVKQLSGGFLALPGFIAISIASITTLVAAFKGLGEKMKDVFSFDDATASAALAKLPPHLKALGQAFYDLRPKFKDLQTAVQATFFEGMGKQISGLAEIYLPRLQKGMVGVAASMQNVRNRFVGFLAEGQTQGDTSAIYNATAQAINHIASATKPAAQGLRDITVIGTQFIAQLMGGMPGVLRKFADWAAINRQNGNLMRWMQEAWQGMKDLTSGIIDGTKALFKLFSIFATNNGENGLARFADSMERFNNAVQKSAASGTLKKIGDYVRNMGTESISKLTDVFRSIFDAAKDAAPVIKDISEYASKILVPAFKLAAQAAETFFDIIESSGLAPFLGILIGIGTAFGLIWKIVSPLRNVIQLLAGAFMAFKGAGDLLKGAVYFLSLMGPAGAKAAGGIGKLAGAFKGLLGAVGIITAVWVAFNQHSQYIKDASQTIDDSLAKNKQSYADLQKAFSQSGGTMNNDVLAKVNENTKNKFAELKTLADQAPGLWSHLMEGLHGGRKSGAEAPSIFEQMTTDWGQSDQFNKIQAVTDAAKQAIQGFEQLGVGQELINKAVAEGGPAYDKLYSDLVKAGEATGAYGENAQASAAQIKQWREEVVKAAQDAATLGEGGFKVIDGIRQIGDAAGDSSSKLSGLKSILEGLGIIKTSSMEAAANYAQGLRDLSNAASSIIVPGESLNSIIDQQTGKLNLNSQGAINLSNALTSISQQYQNAITNGTDAGTAYNEFGARLDELTDKLNNAGQGLVISREQMRALAQEAGTFDPKNLQQKLNQFLTSPDKKKILLDMDINEETIRKMQEQISGAFTGVSMTEQNGLHGGYADKARGAQQKAQEQAASDFKTYAEGLTATLNEQAKNTSSAGESFSKNFAEGILARKDKVVEAADEVAKAAADALPGSPAKRGPLSGQGWSRIRGKSLTSDFARGILTTMGQVQNASDQIAGAAASGLGNTGMGFGGGKQGTNAGKFLGQLLELTGFASQITGIIQKVTDTVFKTLKFISDPLGEGKFFGRKLGFKKTATDEQIARRRGDAIQSALEQTAGNGQRDTTNFDPRTGRMMPPRNPGQLSRDASKGDIQAKIIYEGQSRGMTPQQIQAALATAAHESDYMPNAFGGQQGATKADEVWGIYQQKESWGTQEQRTDPNYAIKAFMDQYQDTLKTVPDPLLAATLTQNPQLGSSAAGSDYQQKQQKALVDAVKDYESLVTNPASIAPGDVGLQMGGTPPIKTKGAGQNYDPAWMKANGFAPLYGRGPDGNFEIPEWANQLAAAFNLTANTYAGNTLHSGNEGWAFDFNSPTGNVGDMERLAQYLEQNMAGNLAQLIFSGSREYGIAGGENVSGPAGQGKYYGYGGQGYPGHRDHVHAGFFLPPGVMPDTAQMPGSQVPGFLQQYSGGDTNATIIQQNPQTGAWETVTPHGQKAGSKPGDTYVDQYGQTQTYTQQQIDELQSKMPMQYSLPDGMTMDEFNNAISDSQNFSFSQDILGDLAKNDTTLTEILNSEKSGFQNLTDAQTERYLLSLDDAIESQKTIDTPVSRARAGKLESLQSGLMDASGFSREINVIDTIAGIASQAVGVASDIIGTITTSIEAVGAAEDITSTLVRGISGTEEVGRIVDNVQKFIELGAKVSGSVASVTGLVGSVVGAAAGSDPSGGAAGAAAALGAVSTIASLIQAGWETANAVIDLTQEAMRIAGTYVGDFLGFLVGGENGPLAGNVKFLLDQKTNQLLTYSAENSMDKRVFDIPFTDQNESSRQQMIGNINVYGGPGSDPRDLTRQMMYQVNSAQYAGALAY